jgi:T-complex protein 1 subunit gamma
MSRCTLTLSVYFTNLRSDDRRVRKSDNNRIARAVGATIVKRVEDLRESDIGRRCGPFNVERIGDE